MSQPSAGFVNVTEGFSPTASDVDVALVASAGTLPSLYKRAIMPPMRAYGLHSPKALGGVKQ